MSEHEDFEASFWGDCCLSLGEELKQVVYLREMGFKRDPNNWRSAYSYDAQNKRIIDIGGGPVSVLLKFTNLGESHVVDPAAPSWPQWVWDRYAMKGLRIGTERGEDLTTGFGWPFCAEFDLALVYNVLQHTDDPEKVIANARQAKSLRMFEWLDTPPHEGHPQTLREADLNKWTGRQGRVIELHGENECYGRAWILGGE